jgi:hypothetical protein
MRRTLCFGVAAVCVLVFLAPAPARADLEWHGFMEAGYGLRTTDAPGFTDYRDYTLQEARAQLRLSSYGERGEVFVRLDVTHDQVIDDSTELELREGFLRFSTMWDKLDVKVGRQALTWGTGDLLFINDLFPKDWVSFFIGREDQYLKAPVDAVRLGLFGLPFDVDIVLTPEFTPDRLPSGRRLQVTSPSWLYLEGMPVEPADALENGELAMRFSRYIGNVDVALYLYNGYFKAPRGLLGHFDWRGISGRFFYPELSVYGASARGSALGGVLSGETGYYDSRQDKDGSNPFVPNSSFRFLGGFERQLYTDFNAGLQFYGEWMMDHEEYAKYAAILFPGSFEQDELRQLFTLRLEKLLRYQTVRLSMFTYYSPTDEDVYIRGLASYRLSDEVEFVIGGNLFAGENIQTQFGQVDKNDNVYTRIRYNF